MTSHRLDGLEPDNLLAFLALLGLLRSLEADDRTRPPQQRLTPRAGWDLERPPLRPRLFLSHGASQDELIARVVSGLERLAESHDFGGRKDLDYSVAECRELLDEGAQAAKVNARERVDLLAALMSDGVLKDPKKDLVAPTPLCLQSGQGHQHFLERMATVPNTTAPPPRGRGRNAVAVTPADCVREALFDSWHRDDPTFGFRWDPEEDVRYALMAGDPTDSTFKGGTQHGANRLGAVGLAAITLVPEQRYGRVRSSVLGGSYGDDGFSFAWPIWRVPATLAAIRALLSHPRLREPGELAHLSVDHVVVARRLFVGKFGNMSRARPIA